MARSPATQPPRRAAGFAAGAAIYDGSFDQTTVKRPTLITRNTASATGTNAQAAGGGVYEEPMTRLAFDRGGEISDNTVHAAGDGSQAIGGAIANTGGVALSHNVIERNRAEAHGAGALARGGGIWNSTGTTAGDSLRIEASEIAHNTANATTGATATGGGLFQAAGPLILASPNSIYANLPNDCSPPGSVPSC